MNNILRNKQLNLIERLLKLKNTQQLYIDSQVDDEKKRQADKEAS